MSCSGCGTFDAPWPGDAHKNRHPWFPPKESSEDPIAQGKLMINNTLTGLKDVFVPMKGRQVRWYTCGPTVYDSAHVGHARAYLSFDIMRRIMSDYFMYNVLYQINITDIDDKIILRARQNELIARLEKDTSVNFAGVCAHADVALEEARSMGASKTSKLEAELSAANAAGDSRKSNATDEQLKMHLTKQANLERDAVAIEAAKGSGDRSAVIAAAKSILSAKLDREQGASVTDHSVFNTHSRKYEREFMEDMRALKIREPDVLTRVTEYIPDIIAFIEKIIAKGMAYASNGSVYLSLEQFKKEHKYRKLSPSGEDASAAEMEESEGALGGVSSEKRSKNDFALWKASKSGEPAWDSPWGQGRPGWHIECSVVASDILGERLDIHSGGEDLKFPHHDNELAQSEACFGSQQWVNYFTHAGHLHIKGLKMSKSLKNFITIRQALENHSARQLRLMFLLQSWDDQVNFSDQTVEDARAKERTFRAFFQEVEALTRGIDYLDDEVGWRMGNKDKALAESLLEAQDKVHRSLLNNFNTRDAVVALLSVISDANVYLRLPNLKPALLTLRKIAQYVTFILKVFGVVDGNDNFGFDCGAVADGAVSAEQAAAPYIDALVKFREEVRAAALDAPNKSDPAVQAVLKACDVIRDETLAEVGVRLEDRPDGPKWNLDDPNMLLAEREEKLEKERETQRLKKQKAIDKLEKDLAKAKAAAESPKDMFKTEEFSAWNEETGLPVTLASGEPISVAQTKKRKKLQDKQQKLHADLLQTASGDVDAFIKGIEQQLADMKK